MIIRSMNNEKEFPEGTTVAACLKALDAFPTGTLAAQSGGVVCELNDELRQDCTLIPLTLENEEGAPPPLSLPAGPDRVFRRLWCVRTPARSGSAPAGHCPD